MTRAQQVHGDAIRQLDVTEALRQQLARLAGALTSQLSDALTGLYVYGSAARGEWSARSSDLNLMIVLDPLDFARLDVVGAQLAGGKRRRGGVVPMTLSSTELREASDVYCIKFDDIRRHHVCIAGAQGLVEGLSISDEALRFVCEFELRNVAMRMRQFYIMSHGQRRFEQDFLMRFFTTSLFPLRALCTLRGRERPTRTPEAIRVIGEVLEGDVGVLERLLEVHRGGEALDQQALSDHYAAFSRLILSAVERVDKL